MTSGITKLIKTVQKLRSKDEGCPWDLAQSHESLAPYFREEVCEFLDDLQMRGPKSPKTWEELGDVLFQVVLHSQLLNEEGLTNFDEIAGRCAEKLIVRHPHVFEPNHPRFRTPDEVNKAWEELKRKSAKPSEVVSIAAQMGAVSQALPQLQRAARIGEKAASFGFDWSKSSDVLAKMSEEMKELVEAAGDDKKAGEEWGDLLFAAAQYARWRKWDPEALLQAACQKFLGRISYMETQMQADEISWDKCSPQTKEQYWNKAKS
jgi:ATP diphosphatase